MTANDQCMWQVKRTRKLDKRHDLRMALCLFESVGSGHHIYKEVWTGKELIVEILYHRNVDILELLFYSQ